MIVVIRGAGDLATGTAVRLHRAGFRVVMTDLARPTAVRRTVAFSQCMYDGAAAVEGCKRANVRIHPWTVKAEADMRALCGIPCEAIITNHPDIARRVVDEAQKA